MPSVRDGLCQSVDALIRDCLAFDETDSPELLQRSKLLDTQICQALTTGQVDVSDSITDLDQLNDRIVGDLDAVPKVYVVEIFPELCDCYHCTVSYLPTLGEDQIPQTWGCVNDSLNSVIPEKKTGCQIKYPQAVKCHVPWQVQKGVIRQKVAMSDT